MSAGNILWVGGIHGVGKSSALDLLAEKYSDRLKKVHLGTELSAKVKEAGIEWSELREPSQLFYAESKVVSEMVDEIDRYDYGVDSHFCVYIGGHIFTGFHEENLAKIVASSRKCGVINVIASPEDIVYRRNHSKKEKKHYPTMENIDVIQRELRESNEYFARFAEIFGKKGFVRTLDTGKLSQSEVARLVEGAYHELSNGFR